MSRNPGDILISVECCHVRSILKGRKTAELRRRQLRIEPGTRVWIYSKLPQGCVEAVATADQVVTASPSALWELYGERLAISAAEFKHYLRGSESACTILLRDIKPLCPALKLAALRRVSRNFHPPQFFKRLVPWGPELKHLTSMLSPS